MKFIFSTFFVGKKIFKSGSVKRNIQQQFQISKLKRNLLTIKNIKIKKQLSSNLTYQN